MSATCSLKKKSVIIVGDNKETRTIRQKRRERKGKMNEI